MYKPYEWLGICKYLSILLSIFLFLNITGGTGYLIVVPFVLAALFLKQSDKMFFWMIFIASSPTISSFFLPKNIIFAVTFRSIMVVIGLYGTLLFLSRKPSSYLVPLMGLFLYLFYMFVPSAYGWAPKVSFLKLGLFMSYYMAVCFVVNELIMNKRKTMGEIRNIIFAFAIFYIIGSIMVLPFHSISYMTNRELLEKGIVVESFFKGVTIHSQTLGMIVAFWVVFLYADFIYHIKKVNWLYIILILCGLYVLYMTSTRTAMGSVIACIGISSWYLLRLQGIGVNWRKRVIGILVSCVALMAVGVAVVPSVRNNVVKYVMKYADDADTSVTFDSEGALHTRQFLVDGQLENFKRSPAIGWGFQVSEELANMANSGELILTAPVEKGVWVTAILEEGGALGAFIYWIYLVFAMTALIKKGAYMGATLFWAIHISNLGEFTMFAMSGVGAIWYVFLFLAIAFDVKRNQDIQQRQNAVYYYSR